MIYQPIFNNIFFLLKFEYFDYCLPNLSFKSKAMQLFSQSFNGFRNIPSLWASNSIGDAAEAYNLEFRWVRNSRKSRQSPNYMATNRAEKRHFGW